MRNCFFALPLVLVNLTIVAALTPQEEAVRLVSEGSYLKAHELVTRLVREASDSGTKAGVPYRAALYQLLGTIEKELDRHSEAQQAFEQGLKFCQQHSPELPELKVSLLVSLAETTSPVAASSGRTASSSVPSTPPLPRFHPITSASPPCSMASPRSIWPVASRPVPNNSSAAPWQSSNGTLARRTPTQQARPSPLPRSSYRANAVTRQCR